MSKKRSNSFSWSALERRGSSDMPVIIVALVMAFFVILFVTLFLYVLPNWQMKKKLENELSLMEITRIERQAMLKDSVKFRDELTLVRQDENKLTETFSEKVARTKLKTDLTKSFVDQGYALQDYHLGASQKVIDRDWMEASLDFTVTGSRDKLPQTIHVWRSTIPVHARLFDVEIRKHDSKKNVKVIVNLAVHFLNPLDFFHPEKVTRFSPLPHASFFESKKVKGLREQIKRQEIEINALDLQLGEVGNLQERKKRLEEILSKRADFSAQRERDFDQLEGQIKRILPKLDAQDHYKIVLKVKETEIQKQKTEE